MWIDQKLAAFVALKVSPSSYFDGRIQYDAETIRGREGWGWDKRRRLRSIRCRDDPRKVRASNDPLVKNIGGQIDGMWC
ncbi:hypothetical protein CBR_g33985 [Chara braunii]|uniref:Uncharacterized protein n=1 Tax=Chara braunii TaxID=69332 RepID=A0A388LHT0_CHABU|nr:hypothetical protein CBR_g33985 [Chara braunii]|eukprot:GBG81805.1 hypothetical protein CBR_g33985 [Chara braunii]